jgi:aminopeptidase N
VTLKQQRFFVDAAQTEPGRWQIPVCVKAAGQASPTCDVVTDVTHSIKLPGSCAPWVFANAGAHGYYRTAYPSALLRAIAPHVETDLAAPERLSLLDDEWAMVRSGRHNIADYLTLAVGYGNERTSGVLDEVAQRLGFVERYLTTAATQSRFEVFARTLFRPLYDEIGFTSTASDTDDRRSLRGSLIRVLGALGRDPDIAGKSRASLDAALSGGAALDPTLADGIVKVAAMHGDAALHDALSAAAERAASPEEHYRYLFSLANFQDPALIDRGLNRALASTLRSQDTATYVAQFFGNPAARPRAWTFLTSHWPALEPKLTIFGGDTTIVRSLGGFCDASSRDAIKAFFAAHPLPAAARTLDQTLEQINNCIALREKQTAGVATWLAQRP